VDIVSKYAGGALPEPARAYFRGLYLNDGASKESGTGGRVTAGSTRRLGGQEKAAYRERGIEDDLRSGASSHPPSPSSSPRISMTAVSRRGSDSGDVGEGGEGGRVPAGIALVAAQRILALATESLDMMKNVRKIVWIVLKHMFFT
jgi:transcriptional repressor OPI1